MVFSAVHLHKYSFLERQTSSGGFCEMGTCSVVRDNPVKPVRFCDGIAQYGEQLTDLEPRFSPPSLEERQDIREEQPAIRQYALADVPGCTLVSVYADKIRCETFVGTDGAVWDSREVKTEVRA